MKRIWILMLATVMLLAVLVGCSNNNTTDPTQPSTPTEPSVTTPTTGEDPTTPTEPTNPTTPTEPSTPDATEPTDPSQPVEPTEPTTPTTPTEPSQPGTEPTEPTQPTEPTEPTVGDGKPPEPDIVKPNIEEKYDALWMVPLPLDDSYIAWRYITTHPEEYIGEQFYALGLYRVIDGKEYLHITREDRFYEIFIEIQLVDNWWTLPENIEMQLCDNCFILLTGTITTKEDGTVYADNCDLSVNAHPSDYLNN